MRKTMLMVAAAGAIGALSPAIALPPARPAPRPAAAAGCHIALPASDDTESFTNAGRSGGAASAQQTGTVFAAAANHLCAAGIVHSQDQSRLEIEPGYRNAARPHQQGSQESGQRPVGIPSFAGMEGKSDKDATSHPTSQDQRLSFGLRPHFSVCGGDEFAIVDPLTRAPGFRSAGAAPEESVALGCSGGREGASQLGQRLAIRRSARHKDCSPLDPGPQVFNKFRTRPVGIGGQHHQCARAAVVIR